MNIRVATGHPLVLPSTRRTPPPLPQRPHGFKHAAVHHTPPSPRYQRTCHPDARLGVPRFAVSIVRHRTPPPPSHPARFRFSAEKYERSGQEAARRGSSCVPHARAVRVYGYPDDRVRTINLTTRIKTFKHCQRDWWWWWCSVNGKTFWKKKKK